MTNTLFASVFSALSLIISIQVFLGIKSEHPAPISNLLHRCIILACIDPCLYIAAFSKISDVFSSEPTFLNTAILIAITLFLLTKIIFAIPYIMAVSYIVDHIYQKHTKQRLSKNKTQVHK